MRRWRQRPADPKARARSQRGAWAPQTVSSARTEDRDIEREVGELASALRERGPMTSKELRRAVESRFWGPGRFGNALWLARRRGLIKREGGRLAAADRDGD